MYLKPSGHIEIIRADGRKLSFDAFHSVEIERDIFKINSSCKIQIPISSRLEYKGKGYTESVQTAKQFARGDKISVWLGYGDNLKLEFSGFIYRLNYKTPLEIECEGYEFLLRSPCETKTWSKTNLKTILEYIIKDTDIVLSDKVPEMNFTKYIIPANMTKLEALQVVKEKYGIAVFFMEKTLYAGLAYVIDLGTVKYKLGWNTIKDDELKYRNADDVRLKIKAVWIKPDNTKLEAEVGDPEGSQRTLFFYNVSSKSELEKLAKEEMKKYKYSGYEGKITTFLQPFAQPGMKGILQDPKYSEREGTYYITKVKVKSDKGGGHRTVEFTVKL
uniref:hypothetical protein n=1 Tax=uncultured Dysgonomonas sp. TaxID=206096 RepID=UPI00261054E9|nr:hypothetical protein [uncultured Dysgonomonas sp.]